MSRRLIIEASLVGLGTALMLVALAADQGWWDRHFLPVFAVDRATMVAAEHTARGLIGLSGAVLSLVLRRPLANALIRATTGGTLRIIVAIVLALGAGELILRTQPPHPHDADPLQQEPRRSADTRLGWVFVPSRSVVVQEAGRRVPYSFDAAGYRVSGPGTAVDPEKPTILFTGESIIAGFGLAWDETIPARVSALLRIQSADLAASDYSSDQSYLRLATELPRFREPVAVVTLFMPSLFDRNLLDNRPHLAAGLIWQPPVQHWRLAALLPWLFPYRSSAAIERGILRTRESLRALVQLARARGAEPLIVVPQFGAESPTEEMLRRRILDAAGLPYVHVPLDPSWHLPGDLHPDARATQAIAIAVAGRLRAALPKSLQGRADSTGADPEPHRATPRIHCSADPSSLTGKSMVSWRLGVDNLPAYDRHHDACAKNVGFGNGHDVIRKDGEVGDFADLDAAALVLLERRVRRPAREHLQCPGPRHALLQVPILIGIAVHGAPGDGGVELDERIALLHRRIAPCHNDGPGVQQGTPRVCPF